MRLKSVFLAVFVCVLSFCSVCFAADIEVTTNTELQSGIESATDGDVIKLMNDITLNKDEYISVKNSITMDLNGCTLSGNRTNTGSASATTAAVIVMEGEDITFTIDDSSADKLGKVIYTGSSTSGRIITVQHGKLILNNGTLEMTWKRANGLYVGSTGSFEMNGGKIVHSDESNEYAVAAVRYEGQSPCSFIMNGGSIEVNPNNERLTALNVAATMNKELSIVINDGTIQGPVSGPTSNNQYIEVKGGTFTSSKITGNLVDGTSQIQNAIFDNESPVDIKLTENTNLEEFLLYIPKDKIVNLDLAGNKLDLAKLIVQGTLNIEDSIGGGIIEPSGVNVQSTTMVVTTDALVNINGGTIKALDGKKAVTVSDGIVYHNAGTIEGETSGVVIGGSPIQIAINNNEEGYTLNEDLDVTDEDNIYLPEGQSFYIDLNGHDLTTNDILAYGELTLHIDAGTLTVNGLSARNNLTIDGENGIIETSNSTKNTITVAKATANVEISDVQIVGGKYGFYTSTANKITMENTSFTTHSTTAGDSAVKIAATEVSFKNCSIVNENGVGIIADPTSSANANYIFTNTTIVAKNNALNNTSPSSKSSKVVPTYSFEGDGNVVISNTGYAINSTAYNAKFEIEDGYFYGANGVFYISKTTSSATVNGGYFGDGLETHKPLTGEGAYTNITVSKDVEEGTWENGDYTYVYKVGDTTPESGWDLRLITNGTITETGAYFENLKLNFSPANPSIGRTIDAYWIGYKFLAPEAVTSENVANVLYSNNSGETWKSFNNAKDGVLEDRYYLEAWVPITEESALNHSQQKTNMKWTYLFDSDGDKENYQTIIIEVCPENLELVKDGKTVAKYVNWNRIFKVTYVDDETDKILGTEEVVSGGKVENIPEITIPEGMCGYDFDYEYVDDEVAFEDLPITQDMEVRIYFYNHIWGEGEVTKEATCTESGEKTYICGNTETHTKKEVIAPLGHTLEKVAEVPATCEEAGTKEHWKCTRCNKIFSDAEGKTEIAEPEELEALGHNFGEWVVVTEATQTERGLKERKCTRCDAKEQEEIPSIDESSWLVDKIYTAGGEQEGNTVKFENLKLNFRPKDYSIGRMLDGYWVGVRFVAPSNVTSETIAATLYNNGSKNTSGELVWKSYKNANDGQREDGRYYMQAWVPLTEETVEEHSKVKSTMVWTYKFATTGDTTNTQDIIIEVNPQNVELVKDGKTVAKYVNWNRIFKVTYVDDETDEILGTEEVVSGEKVENIPEITIPEGMCGYDFDYEYVDDEVAFEDLPITQDMEVRIYFYDHIWGEGEVTTEATCTESGEKTYICGNTETHTKKEVIAPLGHTLEKVAEVPATCEEAGTKEHWKCTRCNKKFSDAEGKTEIAEPEELEALDHDWDEGEVTIEATCTESGEKTYTCENDETHTKKEVIAPLGHNFGEWNIVKEATILEEGKKERICTRCNEKEEEVIPKLETDLMKGDLEGSKTITILDVRLLLQAYINSTETTTWTNEDLYVMDMDGNKKINILDVRLLLQEYINKP